MSSFTPIFIPGHLCTEFLFAKQRAALTLSGEIADTRHHSSITEMAQAALDQCTGPLVPIGLSMGGYVALEMARLSPERMAGMALLNTTAGHDTEDRCRERRQVIKLAAHRGFQGITRHSLSRLISAEAYSNEALVNDILAMAAEVGQAGFIQQQIAIMGRRDQNDTLANFTAPLLILCGTADRLTPPSLSIEMADLAALSTLCLLDGVGHLSSLEAPEAVTAALQDLFGQIN